MGFFQNKRIPAEPIRYNILCGATTLWGEMEREIMTEIGMADLSEYARFFTTLNEDGQSRGICLTMGWRSG
jgi:hypothetical protein